jgi:hypothetical protein
MLMYQTLSAEMKNGKITLIDKATIPEGAHILVTVIQEDDGQFWRKTSETSLDAIWANKEDDVYENLISQ